MSDRKQSEAKYQDAQREIAELRTVIDIIRASPTESRISQRKSDPRADLVVVSWSAQWVQSKGCFCVKVHLLIPRGLMTPPAVSFMLSFGSTTVAGDIERLDPRVFFNGHMFTALIPPLVWSSISPQVPLRLLVDTGSDFTNPGTFVLGSLNDVSKNSVDTPTSEASKHQPPSGSENSSRLNEHHRETVSVGSPNKLPSSQPQKPPLLRPWIADANRYTLHSEAPTVIDGGRFLCTQCCDRLRRQARSTSRRTGALFNSDGPCSDKEVVKKIARCVATGDEHCICPHCSSRLKREAKLQTCFISILFDVESAREGSRPPRDRSYERARPRRAENIQSTTSATSSSSSRRSGKSQRLQVDEISEDKTHKRGKGKSSAKDSQVIEDLRLMLASTLKLRSTTSNHSCVEDNAIDALEAAIRASERQQQNWHNVRREQIETLRSLMEGIRKKLLHPNDNWERRGGRTVSEEFSQSSRQMKRTVSGSSSGSRRR